VRPWVDAARCEAEAGLAALRLVQQCHPVAAITPDGQTLIIAETNGFCLTAFEVGADGSLSNRRVYAQLPEGVQPDGICLDAEGAVWVANPGEHGASVLRVREGGEVTDTIELDHHAYAVALGGPERRHLFICSSPTHDPAEIATNPGAQILVCEVAVPGAGTPGCSCQAARRGYKARP